MHAWVCECDNTYLNAALITAMTSLNHLSPEFQTFLLNFENLYSKIKAENPLAMFFTGDFNAHSQLWWPGGDTTHEGTVIDELFTKLGLFQIISEPTNFEPNKSLHVLIYL